MTRDCFYVISKKCRNPASRQFSVCAFGPYAHYYDTDKHVCEDHVKTLEETFKGYTLREIRSDWNE